MSLVARHLEAQGMPTVIIGSARDVVEHCGVPRFLFVDFPLGNPCGRPWDEAMQRRIVAHAVELFETVNAPMTTVVSPERWDGDAWRARYMQVTPDNRAELARLGRERRERRGGPPRDDEATP